MVANSALITVTERGWRRGIRNLIDNELARWFRTRMWWVQCLIWPALTAMFLGSNALRNPWYARDFLCGSLEPLVGVFQPIALIAILQGVLVNEKAEGTAAWVLSKPASRASFVLSKVAGSIPGVVATMVIWPGLLHYGYLAYCKVSLRPHILAAVMGVWFLHHLFYMTLMVMLGSLLRSRGAQLGITFGLLALQFNLVPKFPFLRYVLPITLSLGPGLHALKALVMGRSFDPFVPVVVGIALECVLFVGVAVWRFGREEL